MRIAVTFSDEDISLIEAEADLQKISVREVVQKAVRYYFLGREIEVLDKAKALEALRHRGMGSGSEAGK